MSISSNIVSSVILVLGFTSAFTAQASSLEQQRAMYQQAQKAFTQHDMSDFQRLTNKLGDYPLYPYLEYKEFNANLAKKSPSEVKAFIEKYQNLQFSRTIKTSYLYDLAQDKQWKDFLTVQPTKPNGVSLQCSYYYAKNRTGYVTQSWQGAEQLWKTGSSLPNSCDALLEAWIAAGKRSNGLILDRMLLAYGSNNISLIRYLDKQLTGSEKTAGDQLLALYEKPQGVADFAKKSKVTTFNKELTEKAFMRLARNDPKQAVSQYNKVMKGQHFSTSEQQVLADRVSSYLMSTDDPTLASWRDSKLKTTHNVSLLERRIRNAIREANWPEVQTWINRLPKASKNTLRWRFWQAQLLAKNGHKQQADKIYRAMLGQRDFYSAAAATILSKPIVYPTRSAPKTTPLVKPYDKTLAVIDELIKTNQLTLASREWGYLLSRVSNVATKSELAAYAKQHKWYHLTVQATISGQLWDYMSLRFPIAHRWWFDFFSKQNDIPAATMMALSRQESALNVNAQSHVGARGLMQLMPATAEHTAEKIGHKYSGNSSLFDPGVNIRLGSSYLKMMLDENDNNRIYSFASYNAGPNRVKRWKKETDGKLDVFSFIEQIPFSETRQYVQNVLMFEVYYNELMGKKAPLLQRSELTTQY